jgi:glycosyltransferase involved in cell wall biosynthesis
MTWEHPSVKVALVHDWLTGMRGGEKCLEAFCELLPEADLFTLVHVPGSGSPAIEDRRITTSFLQKFPGISRTYRYFLPLMPAAAESFDLSGYDLVLSSSHCVAKGVIPAPEALHVSYVHTPMRYAWDLRDVYFPPRGFVNRFLVPPVLSRLRLWDVATACRVDRFVTNSAFVARRIERYYSRKAEVLHPPVDCESFRPSSRQGDYYLLVAALVPYKGIEVAIEAFEALGRPLKIVGRGPLERALRRQARGSVQVLGWMPDEPLRDLVAGCRAFVFPATEDFGIAAVEAMAAGRPVIALAEGGALETVVPLNDLDRPGRLRTLGAGDARPTGVYFAPATPEALAEAVRFFEAHEEAFDPPAIRRHASRFDRNLFKERMRKLLDDAVNAHAESRADRAEPATLFGA